MTYKDFGGIPNIMVIVVMVVAFIILIAMLMDLMAMHTGLVKFTQILFHSAHKLTVFDLGNHLLGFVHFWKDTELDLVFKLGLNITDLRA